MEKNSSKILSGDNEQEDVQQWHPPDMGDALPTTGGVKRPTGSMLTASQLEALQKQAYQEGFELGKKEGFAVGQRDARAAVSQQVQGQINRFDALMQTLDKPLSRLDEQVERELVELCISMVRLLVRREIRTDPNQIVGVVREALSILPVASRNVSLILNPEDANLIREIYSMSEQEQGWTIKEDPLISRGGCRVVTDTSQVDATLESRLANIIAPLLGGERDADLDAEEGQ